jgi:hypothetical protein
MLQLERVDSMSHSCDELNEFYEDGFTVSIPHMTAEVTTVRCRWDSAEVERSWRPGASTGASSQGGRCIVQVRIACDRFVELADGPGVRAY